MDLSAGFLKVESFVQDGVVSVSSSGDSLKVLLGRSPLESAADVRGPYLPIQSFLSVDPTSVRVKKSESTQFFRSRSDSSWQVRGIKGDQDEVVIEFVEREQVPIRILESSSPDGVYRPVAGAIRNFTNYGIFVELEEGVDGLIHISDLSWSKKIKHPSEFASLGETIEVIILELDMDDRKVSLGHKQLEENPWEVFETVLEVGSVHKGTGESVNDKGAVVSLPHGVEGFSPSRHSVKEDGTKLNAEDTVDFSVLEFSKEGKRILISHLDTYGGEVPKSKVKPKSSGSSKGNSMRKAMSNVRNNLEKTTLGDIDALSMLKSNLEEAENKGKAKKAAAKKSKSADAEE